MLAIGSFSKKNYWHLFSKTHISQTLVDNSISWRMTFHIQGFVFWHCLSASPSRKTSFKSYMCVDVHTQHVVKHVSQKYLAKRTVEELGCEVESQISPVTH